MLLEKGALGKGCSWKRVLLEMDKLRKGKVWEQKSSMEQTSRNKSPGIKSPGNKSPSAAGGGMPGGTVGAIVAQPKDMEINIDRHKDRKQKPSYCL